MGPRNNFILAAINWSPLHYLRTSKKFATLRSQLSNVQLMDAVPTVSFWSDIAWASWVSLCKQENRKPSELQFVIHDTVTTPNTKYIMEQVIDPTTVRDNLTVSWPGKAFRMNTDGGLALLGTVHGSGTSRLLFDHRQAADGIPKKGIQTITVVTGDQITLTGRKYHLIFELSRGKT